MKEKIVWIFVVLYLCSFHLNAQMQKIILLAVGIKLQLKELGVGLPIREPCIMKTRREL